MNRLQSIDIPPEHIPVLLNLLINLMNDLNEEHPGQSDEQPHPHLSAFGVMGLVLPNVLPAMISLGQFLEPFSIAEPSDEICGWCGEIHEDPVEVPAQVKDLADALGVAPFGDDAEQTQAEDPREDCLQDDTGDNAEPPA